MSRYWLVDTIGGRKTEDIYGCRHITVEYRQLGDSKFTYFLRMKGHYGTVDTDWFKTLRGAKSAARIRCGEKLTWKEVANE